MAAAAQQIREWKGQATIAGGRSRPARWRIGADGRLKVSTVGWPWRDYHCQLCQQSVLCKDPQHHMLLQHLQVADMFRCQTQHCRFTAFTEVDVREHCDQQHQNTLAFTSREQDYEQELDDLTAQCFPEVGSYLCV